MRALCRDGRKDTCSETVPAPSIGGPAGRHHRRDERRDLRLGPAPDGWADADHGVERRGRPRVHGRGDRSRHTDYPLREGDRVIVRFNVIGGRRRMRRAGKWASFMTSNRDGEMAARMFGRPPAGLFGYPT